MIECFTVELTDVNVIFTSLLLETSDVKEISLRNRRTSKLTAIAPIPNPKCAIFKGVAAFTPHI